LRGTSNACTVAQFIDDGDRGYDIDDALNTACRCLTPHRPLFRRNQLNSCLLVHIFSPTHKRTERRAPVWGSEFTSKDAALQKGIQQKPLLG
jgi:hypothetical protein